MFKRKGNLSLSAFVIIAQLLGFNSTVNAKEVVSYTSPYTSDYMNVYFHDYTLVYDSGAIEACNKKLDATQAPANHNLYYKMSLPVRVQVRQDPLGRGYYEDMKMYCSVTFINPSVDCSHGNNVYVNGDTRTEKINDRVDCLSYTTTYTCNNTAWIKGASRITRIPNCIPL